MIDEKEQKRLNEIAAANTTNAEKYLEVRQLAAKAKYELDVIIAKRYLDGELDKKIAYEKALLLIAGESLEYKELYKNLLKYESIYKGLEKVIEANADIIRLAQSTMKYLQEGERYG